MNLTYERTAPYVRPVSVPDVPLTGDVFDPYATLGISRGAEAREILTAYRDLARRHHPDLTSDPRAQRRMVEINAAWAIMRDPVRKAAWDHAGGLSAPASHTLHRPHVTMPQAEPASASCTWRRGEDGEGAAGPPPGRPSGSVLTFGRHLCWTIGEVARADPGYLQWLATRPEGRPYRAEIEAVLAPLLKREPEPQAPKLGLRRRLTSW
jgi:curved DNA-binding protein CbpA